MITVNQITPRHSVDDGTVIITELYLTQDHCLLMNGQCAKCQMQVSILVPLTQLFKDCPDPEPQPLVMNTNDIRWLKALKIVPPEPTKLLSP